MKLLKNFVVFTTVILGVNSLPLEGASLLITSIGTDLELNDAFTQIDFVGEGRIGDRGGAATFEVDIGSDTGAPADTDQFNWPNGGSVAFALSYDAGSNVASLTVGTETVSYQPLSTSFDSFAIRARATKANSFAQLSNLSLDLSGNVTAITQQVLAVGSGTGLDILMISNVPGLSNGFTLSGTTVFSWDPQNQPRNSQLAYQVKVGEAIPEPSTYALLLLSSIAGLIAYRKKRITTG
ncbi:MAG: choice-of-anchor W domain-containing protein [Verrucomicrobiota bacterium]